MNIAARTYCPSKVCSLFTAHRSQSKMHAFSAKEKDAETGLSYFGSRYYSSDLSIWLSVDPMSGKYPHLSAFTYCADNPVKLVDPNGEEVEIEWKNSVYRYEHDGTLTLIKGEALSEKVQNKFINKTRNSLNQIGKTVEGKKIISDLSNSKDTYVIKSGAKSSFNMHSNTITWCANGTDLPVLGTPWGECNGTFDLAHELSHAYDKNNDWTDRTEIGGLDKNEWVACYRENLIRSEMGGKPRTFYMINRTESGSFQGGTGPSLLNSENEPYMPFDIESYEKKK